MIDFTCGDLNYTFSPYESNRVRVTGLGFYDVGDTDDVTNIDVIFESQDKGFADFIGESSETDRKFIRKVLINHTKYLFPKLTWSRESDLWVGYRYVA